MSDVFRKIRRITDGDLEAALKNHKAAFEQLFYRTVPQLKVGLRVVFFLALFAALMGVLDLGLILWLFL